MKSCGDVLQLVLLSLFIANTSSAQIPDVREQVEHHLANSNGVKIHYVTMGEGPLILFIHGFPDFWYSWRDQMLALSKNHKVAAMDMRGYNMSDSPAGVENYTYEFLMSDIKAVIEDLGNYPVSLVAHDWGAAISWNFSAHYPEYIKKLVILNIAHPNAGDKKIPVPIEERKPTYADYFASKEFDKQLNENWFSGWVNDQNAKEAYKIAFRKSDKTAMINYYRANFPLLENLKNEKFVERSKRSLPNIKAPVLIIHGEKDQYALTKAHNNTWDYVDNEVIIHVLPTAGHFIQQDESAAVTRLIKEFIEK